MNIDIVVQYLGLLGISSSSIIIKKLIGGPSDFGIGWLIILISATISILGALIGFISWLFRKLTKKSRFLKIVSKLTVGVNIEHLKSLVGEPIFINRVGNFEELIFVYPYFFLQVLIGVASGGEVLLFSVTTRDKKFNPKLNLGVIAIPFGIGKWKHYFSKKRLVELGKTKFSDLGDTDKILKKHGTMHGVGFYSELHYFGNPGNYLDYAFSINENGYIDIPPYNSLSFFENISDDPKNEETKKFRDESAINTYTVIGSLWRRDVEKMDIEFGPRQDQTRILNG